MNLAQILVDGAGRNECPVESAGTRRAFNPAGFFRKIKNVSPDLNALVSRRSNRVQKEKPDSFSMSNAVLQPVHAGKLSERYRLVPVSCRS